MFREFLTLSELHNFDRERIAILQNRRLSAISKHLLPSAPFYHEFFKKHKVDPSRIKSAEDWKALGLPLIKKKLYMKRPRDFIVTPQGKPEKIFSRYLSYAAALNRPAAANLVLTALLSKFSKHFSEDLTHEVKAFFRPKMPAFAGGTESGRPIPVLLTAKQKFQQMVNTADVSAYLIITRHFKEGGKKGITGMNLFPYAPHIAWQIINMAAELRTDLNLSTAAGGFLGTEKLIRIAKSCRPNVYSGMVDYLINVFLPRAYLEGVRLKGKAVFLNGATKMLEVQRRQIKELFRKLGASPIVALDGYGASELKEATLAECEEGSGLHHVAPLSNIIRTVKIGRSRPGSDYIYDWDFTADEEGGYAAVWNIDGAGTLLEGYLLGDHYERIEHGRCPHCGLNVMRVYNVNRIADLATEMKIMGIDEEKIDGTTVNLTALREQILHLKGLLETQLIVERGNPMDRLLVKYASADHHDQLLRSQIKDIFHSSCDVRPSEIKKVPLSELYRENELKYLGIVRRKNGAN